MPTIARLRWRRYCSWWNGSRPPARADSEGGAMATNGTPANPEAVVGQPGKLEMGIIGLGRMGGNTVKRLRERGHRIAGYAPTPAPGWIAVADGRLGAHSH